MWAVLTGVVIGVAYTLSPLTIVFLALLAPLWRWVSRGLPAVERRWLLSVLCLAIALRLLVVGGLFLTADSAIPYANFFGDEEFFKRRTTWMLNLGLDVPISPADYFYAFDQTGDTSYLYFLAYVQALVGLAPYGVHVLNTALYLTATLVLYRLARPSLGGIAALGGVVGMLLLPSLFIWSISALKEPLYFLVVAGNLVAAVSMMRSQRWWQRLLALASLAAGGVLLQSIREGGLALTVVGTLGGAALATLIKRPRLLVISVAIVPLVAALAITRPAIQERLWSAVHEAAYKHWGHVHTAGLTYKILDDRLYSDRDLIPTMTAPEAGRFVVRALHSYLTVPLPWQIESRAALAFLPEQIVWYLIAMLVPIGAVAGFRRDPVLTSLLLAHGVAVSLMVALSGGNVGTLVRHRGLSIPYFAWLSSLGAVAIVKFILVRVASPSPSAPSPISTKAGLA